MTNKIFVIKIGGEIINQAKTLQLICDGISKLLQNNIKVILVHGGGVQITHMAEKLAVKPCLVNGRRVTDWLLYIVKMVLAGKINIEILSKLRGFNISAVELVVLMGGFHACKRAPQQLGNQVVDFGAVGDIVKVTPALILQLINDGYVPVIAPLAADEMGTVFNINADTVAANLALALNVDKWIILTNVAGILDNKKNC